jgi:hypothetical protein
MIRLRGFAASAQRVRLRGFASLLAMVLAVARLGAQAAPEGLTVTASVDRPAIWIADRLLYTVEIVCPRGYDILTGDLARDRLKLTGLEIVSSDTIRREGDVTRYRFEYVLTTYRVDVATPAIGAFPVRYYLTRAGQRPEEAAPAGSVTVPPLAVAFRSLLPDDQAIYDVRDAQPVPPPQLPYRLLAPAGVALMLVSIVPAALLVSGFARGWRQRRRAAAPRSSRQTRRAARAALDELRAIDAGDVSARRGGFARLDALLRQHLTDVCGVPAAGMTPEELEAALRPCAGRVPIPLAASVLGACELARYANPELQPPADAFRDAVSQVEQILSGRATMA